MFQKSEDEDIVAATNANFDDIAEPGDDDDEEEEYNDVVEDEDDDDEGMMPPTNKKAKVELPDVVDDQDQVKLLLKIIQQGSKSWTSRYLNGRKYFLKYHLCML